MGRGRGQLPTSGTRLLAGRLGPLLLKSGHRTGALTRKSEKFGGCSGGCWLRTFQQFSATQCKPWMSRICCIYIRYSTLCVDLQHDAKRLNSDSKSGIFVRLSGVRISPLRHKTKIISYLERRTQFQWIWPSVALQDHRSQKGCPRYPGLPKRHQPAAQTAQRDVIGNLIRP